MGMDVWWEVICPDGSIEEFGTRASAELWAAERWPMGGWTLRKRYGVGKEYL